ncbi:hypothetical protein HO173_004017 [Letharia columbiana]|uniref:Uncharacterized protein n=1 Tax=Letharia columbiana TaxID=112416 RepID=A0A8H6G016_9LECA|nr:uncharacterized protein HO173_004017 [Letharia columbiana]KAF6237816.1 hypothetical protein HO173_004017 [Letharia columbiana]
MSRILPATRIGKSAPASLYNTGFRSSRAPCRAPDGIAGQVCNRIESVQLSDMPSNVQTKVKYLVLDAIACAIVGAKLPWSKVATQPVWTLRGLASAPSLAGTRYVQALLFLEFGMFPVCLYPVLRTASAQVRSMQPSWMGLLFKDSSSMMSTLMHRGVPTQSYCQLCSLQRSTLRGRMRDRRLMVQRSSSPPS